MKIQHYIPQNTSLCSKPVEIRPSTDRLFILLLPINLLLWLGVVFYYIYLDASIMGVFHFAFPWSIVSSVTASAVISIILIAFILDKYSNKIVPLIRIFIAVVIAMIILLFCITLYAKIYALSGDIISSSTFELSPSMVCSIALVIVSVISLIYHVTIFIITKKLDETLLTQMLHVPSRAILGSLFTLLFSIVIVLLLTNIFILNTAINFGHLHEAFNGHLEHIFWLWMRTFAFAFGGTYVFNFIWNFGFTVMGDFFANYHSPGHQKETYVFQSIKKVVRNHLGTVSFLSIPILPYLYALIMAFKNNREIAGQYKSTIANFFSKVCFIMDITDYASMQTSIYGHSAVKSIKEMSDLHQSNSVLFLITNAASLKMAEVSTAIPVIIGSIIEILILQMHLNANNNSFSKIVEESLLPIIFAIRVIVAMVYVNLTSKLLIRPAMCTFSIYKMASLRESEELEESGHPKDLQKV